MKLKRILDWTEKLLSVDRFDDVSNNGLQISRTGEEVSKVAFAVDGSVRSVKAAAAAGAQLLVVHHGISWGGGIRRIVGAEYNVIKAAMEADLALAAYHLPLDANRRVGNNWELARHLGLVRVKPAFSYHGNVIGVTGVSSGGKAVVIGDRTIRIAKGQKIGICSGGAGEFAADAKALGCDLYITGEASWGDVIAAENIGVKMITAGHYETETFGVKALARAMKKALGVATLFVSLLFAMNVGAEEEYDRFYLGASGSVLLPQGGAPLDFSGVGELRFGVNLGISTALEAEAGWLERHAALAVRGIFFWHGCELYDRFFGFSRFDPFFTLGAKGWVDDGDVGPAAGLGALYYLTDSWALRFDAEATLGLERDREMYYSLGTGLQYSF